METTSKIEGTSRDFEGSPTMRQWTCRVFQVDYTEDEDEGTEVELGHARLFTAPSLDPDTLAEADELSGALETVVGVLCEEDLWGPALIIDKLFVEEPFRRRGLAPVVAQAAIDWFQGLVNLVALVVTDDEFRPAVTGVVKKLGFRNLKDDVWVLELE